MNTFRGIVVYPVEEQPPGSPSELLFTVGSLQEPQPKIAAVGFSWQVTERNAIASPCKCKRPCKSKCKCSCGNEVGISHCSHWSEIHLWIKNQVFVCRPTSGNALGDFSPWLNVHPQWKISPQRKENQPKPAAPHWPVNPRQWDRRFSLPSLSQKVSPGPKGCCLLYPPNSEQASWY